MINRLCFYPLEYLKKILTGSLFTPLEIMPAAPSGPEALWAGGFGGVRFYNNSGRV